MSGPTRLRRIRIQDIKTYALLYRLINYMSKNNCVRRQTNRRNIQQSNDQEGRWQ